MECDRDRYGSVFYRADQCGFKQEAGRVICRFSDFCFTLLSYL